MPQPWPWVKVMDRSSSIFPQIYIFFAPNVYISASEMKFSVNELGVSHKKITQGDVSMAINFNYLNPFAAFIIFLVGQALYLVTLNRISFQYGNGTGGNRTKLPSSRWRRRGRSLREVFACSRLFATTDLSQIYNREARRHGTPCTKTTDSYLFSFLYNNPRKIRRETTVGKFVPNNGRR